MSRLKNVPSLISGNTAENDCQLSLINKSNLSHFFYFIAPQKRKSKILSI